MARRRIGDIFDTDDGPRQEQPAKGAETGPASKATVHPLQRPESAPETKETVPGTAEAAPEALPVAKRVADAPAAPKAGTPPAPAKSGGKRKRILSLILLAAIGAGSWYGHHWWTVGRFIESTDDAYVEVHMSMVAPRLAGYISQVLVEDNQSVKAGEPLIVLDDADQKLAVQAAQDQVATQKAAIDRIDRQVAAARTQVDQASAELKSAQAAAGRAAADYERYATLVKTKVVSEQRVDQALADRDQTAAAVAHAEAGVAAAEANVDVLSAQKTEASRTLAQYETTLDRARLDLGYMTIAAPIDGTVGNLAVQVGEYVSTGQRLMALVPLGDVYVDANFKETQLSRLKPGQSASIVVDAFTDRDIKGTVVSVAPAAGAMFSLLPPENATGNFTKIVQRVPVRIRVPADVAGENLLRPGLSVVVDVDTRTRAGAGKAVAAPAN